MNLSDAANAQIDLFSTQQDNIRLMQVMDRINRIWGRGTLKSAAEGIRKGWGMKRERMSPCYTSNWKLVPVVG